MARILLITSDDGASWRSTFQSLGHTVNWQQGYASAATLDAAWGAEGYDLIVLVYISTAGVSATWATAKWQAGVPVLVDNRQTWARDHGLTDGTFARGNYTDAVIEPGHPAVAGRSGRVAIRASATSDYGWHKTNPMGGTLLGSDVTYPDLYRISAAYEAGDRRMATGGLGDPVPARAIVHGWMRYPASGFTADGLAILDASVAWLASGGSLDLLHPGADTATGLYLGDQPVAAAYLGTEQVY